MPMVSNRWQNVESAFEGHYRCGRDAVATTLKASQHTAQESLRGVGGKTRQLREQRAAPLAREQWRPEALRLCACG